MKIIRENIVGGEIFSSWHGNSIPKPVKIWLNISHIKPMLHCKLQSDLLQLDQQASYRLCRFSCFVVVRVRPIFIELIRIWLIRIWGPSIWTESSLSVIKNSTKWVRGTDTRNRSKNFRTPDSDRQILIRRIAQFFWSRSKVTRQSESAPTPFGQF